MRTRRGYFACAYTTSFPIVWVLWYVVVATATVSLHFVDVTARTLVIYIYIRTRRLVGQAWVQTGPPPDFVSRPVSAPLQGGDRNLHDRARDLTKDSSRIKIFFVWGHCIICRPSLPPLLSLSFSIAVISFGRNHYVAPWTLRWIAGMSPLETTRFRTSAYNTNRLHSDNVDISRH